MRHAARADSLRPQVPRSRSRDGRMSRTALKQSRPVQTRSRNVLNRFRFLAADRSRSIAWNMLTRSPNRTVESDIAIRTGAWTGERRRIIKFPRDFLFVLKNGESTVRPAEGLQRKTSPLYQSGSGLRLQINIMHPTRFLYARKEYIIYNIMG